MTENNSEKNLVTGFNKLKDYTILINQDLKILNIIMNLVKVKIQLCNQK